MNQKAKNWIFVLVWAGLIFLLSHQPFLKSDLPNQWDFVLRKIAHITEYAVLTWILIRALREYKLSRRQILTLAVVLSLVYAASDEYHQTFVLGREGTIRDVLIDSLGIILAAWLKKRKMVK